MLKSFPTTNLASNESFLVYDAIAAVEPGSHFFGFEHTMERYQTALYEPLVSGWSNFGQWGEDSLTATQRAHGIWQQTLQDFEAPALDLARAEHLQVFIRHSTAQAEGCQPLPDLGANNVAYFFLSSIDARSANGLCVASLFSVSTER